MYDTAFNCRWLTDHILLPLLLSVGASSLRRAAPAIT